MTLPSNSWLPMHPDSVGARLANGRWFPLLHLVWLFWMVSAPWFVGHGDTRVVVLTFLSLPVFLLLYYRAWYGDRVRIAWNTAAIAVLGLAMVPLNTSWSYIIYAAVIIPYCAPPRRALVWLALLMLLFSSVAVSVGFSPLLCLSAVTMCVALSLINMAGRITRERDAELRLSHDEVRRLAAPAERERIGRDLHDLLGHSLSLIAIKSELADKLFERDPRSARRELRELHDVARESLAQVRAAVTGIRAAALAGEIAAAKLLLESSGVALKTTVDEVEIPHRLESELALCLREAVTNIHRHAGASGASIAILRQDRGIELRIADDGRGGVSRDGNGLAGMRERAAEFGGSLQLESPRGRGTVVTIRARLPEPEPVPVPVVTATPMTPTAGEREPRLAPGHS